MWILTGASVREALTLLTSSVLGSLPRAPPGAESPWGVPGCESPPGPPPTHPTHPTPPPTPYMQGRMGRSFEYARTTLCVISDALLRNAAARAAAAGQAVAMISTDWRWWGPEVVEVCAGAICECGLGPGWVLEPAAEQWQAAAVAAMAGQGSSSSVAQQWSRLPSAPLRCPGCRGTHTLMLCLRKAAL